MVKLGAAPAQAKLLSFKKEVDIWRTLRHPFICAFPDTTFVCVHWSLRYSRDDILGFFAEQYGGVPNNVVLWV